MKIRSLTLPSPEPDRLARFYRDLGFSTRSTDNPMGRVLEVGDTEIKLVYGPNPVGAHHLAFTISTAALPAARRLLAGKATLWNRDGKDQFHLDAPFGPSESVYFDAPDGSLLELIGRDHPYDADDFDPSRDVLGVGEVGVPTLSVPIAVDQLRRDRGLAAVIESPDFAAVGDHWGMIILISSNRTWYPTEDRRPEPTPLHITIDAIGPPLVFSNGTALT